MSQAGNRFGERVAAEGLVEGNRKPKPVAHEINVALDRLHRHLDLGRKLVPVWALPGLDDGKDLLHAIQGRPRVQHALPGAGSACLF